MVIAPLSLDDIKDVNTFADTFWAKVDFGNGPDDCWMWQAALTAGGYGHIAVPLWGGYKPQSAHRVAWLLTYGELPLLLMCHTCDVRHPDTSYRACVNPDHLFAGTVADNIQDMWNKGRGQGRDFAIGERHGLTKLTDAQVLAIRYLYAQGTRRADLSTKFDTPIQTITNIVQCLTWKHLGGQKLTMSEARRGARNGRAVVTEDDVRVIRQRSNAGECQADLAREYGVTPPAIAGIVKRRTWKHVA